MNGEEGRAGEETAIPLHSPTMNRSATPFARNDLRAASVVTVSKAQPCVNRRQSRWVSRWFDERCPSLAVPVEQPHLIELNPAPHDQDVQAASPVGANIMPPVRRYRNYMYPSIQDPPSRRRRHAAPRLPSHSGRVTIDPSVSVIHYDDARIDSPMGSLGDRTGAEPGKRSRPVACTGKGGHGWVRRRAQAPATAAKRV